MTLRISFAHTENGNSSAAAFCCGAISGAFVVSGVCRAGAFASSGMCDTK